MENEAIAKLQRLAARIDKHAEELIRLAAETACGKGVPVRLNSRLHDFKYLVSEISQTASEMHAAYPPDKTAEPMREALAAAYRDIARGYDKCSIASDELIKALEANKCHKWAP